MFVMIAQLIKIVSQTTRGMLTIRVKVLSSRTEENPMDIKLNAYTSGVLKNGAIQGEVMYLQGFYFGSEMLVTSLVILSDKLPEEVINTPELLKRRGEAYRIFLSEYPYRDYDEIGDFLY